MGVVDQLLERCVLKTLSFVDEIKALLNDSKTMGLNFFLMTDPKGDLLEKLENLDRSFI